MKLSEAVTGYFLTKTLEFSKTTIPGYRLVFRRLIAFLDDPQIEQVKTADVRRFLVHLSTLGLSRRTVSDAWVKLSSLWTWAETELEIPHIIRGKIKQPDYTERVIHPFTQDELKRLAKAVTLQPSNRNGKTVQVKRTNGPRDLAMLMVLVDSGIRASELCALTIGDYDQRRGRLRIQHGKGDKERVAIVGDRTRKSIWKYMLTRPEVRPAEPLFATRNGTAISRTELRHQLKRAGQRANVPNVHPHRFRHTYAITFLRNGGNIALLRVLLGHESLEMVLHYARVADIDLDSAAQHSPADNWKL